MTTNESNYKKKKNDNDNLKKYFFCKKRQIVQLNSQPIKYKHTKMDKKMTTKIIRVNPSQHDKLIT